MGGGLMSRSADLLARQEDALATACAIRFVRDATTGHLTDDAFRRYLVIEEAFVLTSVKVLGLVVAESVSLDDAVDHVRSLANLAGEQRSYFTDLRARFPWGSDTATLVAASSTLSDHALSLARTDGRAAALVGMFAAESMYLRWCRAARQVKAIRAPELQEWIDLHTRPRFVAQVKSLARELDAMTEAVGDADLDRWFKGMLTAEIDFHAIAVR